MKGEGKLLVFSAPSGSGKTTIVRWLLAKEELNLEFSISATSRQPREGEKHGVDYYFLSLHDFKQHIKDEDFLEVHMMIGMPAVSGLFLMALVASTPFMPGIR